MVGAIVGGIGGLFAIGLAAAIINHSPARLFATPILSLISWIISGPSGWILGGQIGPRLGMRYQSRDGEIVGGIIGGLIPVVSIALYGWYRTVCG